MRDMNAELPHKFIDILIVVSYHLQTNKQITINIIILINNDFHNLIIATLTL